MIRRPPRSTRTDTLFPYTTLFRSDPSASDGVIEKDRQRFAHAPLVIAVLAILDPDDRKIPEQERLLSAGAACFALLQAAQALGFGANWLTGWPAHDPQAHALLGMGEHERVVGFVHIGTPMMQVPERERPDASALLTDRSEEHTSELQSLMRI